MISGLTGPRLDDDNGHLFEHDINQVAQAGITGGQANRTYSPECTGD